MCQPFLIVALCLNPLYNRLCVFYCLMVLLWRGLVVHRICFAPLQCTHILLRSLPLFSAIGALNKKQLVLCQYLEVSRLSSPLAYVIVEHPRIFQNGRSLWTLSWRWRLSGLLIAWILSPFPPVQSLGQGVPRVIGPHHLDCVILEVDLVDRPVSGGNMLYHGECRQLS